MALDTTLETAEGAVMLTDFMPPRGEHSDVVRVVRGVRGTVMMRMDLVLRFDYGRTVPWVTKKEREWRAVAGALAATLRWSCVRGTCPEVRGEELTTVSEFMLREGDEVCFVLTCSESQKPAPPEVPVQEALTETVAYWSEWAEKSQYKGEHTDAVMRSLMTLEALTYKPTGGMVAAPTMALPEEIGGERNWDYRYCWLRDTSFVLLVLMRAGYTDEAARWREWLMRAVAGSPNQVQVMYGLSGERQLVEWEVPWLRGYEDSKPVRVGNAASEQFQLDVSGEVVLALHRAPAMESGDTRDAAVALQANLVDYLCHVWDQPDDGIWEMRDGRQHFVHSKVMAWVGLDRAIKHYEMYDGKGDVERWRKNRDLLHREICEKGFNKKLNSFTQAYGSTALDAACLRLGPVGFLPADDPRIVGTVEAIEKHLMRDGLLRRYDTGKTSDGLKGGEGAFLACSFWLVTALFLIGRKTDAEALFGRLLALSNDVGLLSEEYDAKGARMLGNFPQALSHIALVHAAFTLSGQFVPELGHQPGD